MVQPERTREKSAGPKFDTYYPVYVNLSNE